MGGAVQYSIVFTVYCQVRTVQYNILYKKQGRDLNFIFNSRVLLLQYIGLFVVLLRTSLSCSDRFPVPITSIKFCCFLRPKRRAARSSCFSFKFRPIVFGELFSPQCGLPRTQVHSYHGTVGTGLRVKAQLHFKPNVGMLPICKQFLVLASLLEKYGSPTQVLDMLFLKYLIYS